jgi:subtilase family serine protease
VERAFSPDPCGCILHAKPFLDSKPFVNFQSDIHRQSIENRRALRCYPAAISLDPTIAAAALLLVFASFTPTALAQPQSLLTRHVREVTLNGQAPFVGRLPATQSMHIDIVLPVCEGLDSFLHELYNPSSPSFRQFLTVEQFTERFGPSQQDFDALIRFAKTNGFTVTGGSRDAMDVQLKGSVATIETAFHVTMGLYHDPIENRNFYAPDREPTVDLPFQLWHITGLANYSIPRHALVRRDSNVNPPATTGSCSGASFCGSDMRAAYYQGTALTGKGQNIGLLGVCRI